MKNYSYPLDLDWTSQEMATVIRFFNAVESAYESRVDRQEVLDAYRAFKEIVPRKNEEKQLGRAFEERSGYSCYRVVQAARQSDRPTISMPEKR
ncbi:hypothetical protein AWM75_02905 [Aerococcus urinaehominis]|uniref:UPF0223 protein AWM75_02905 n=1 Tax=Aerococcus urinaehominis TaxID=128944 RepID=A0A109RGP4_9LACT|nr:UPF0223 family protein [Aerococcus urinaehominis]AMB99009.1 hypothetical protein AWM75_02905 [Aerococcus urinaehominis]SDM57180.1 Uncharacterized protein YktA, UPF0223 family [Aerococcus urinaehominis]